MFKLYLAHSFSEHPTPTIIVHSILRAYNVTMVRKARLPLSLQPSRGADYQYVYEKLNTKSTGGTTKSCYKQRRLQRLENRTYSLQSKSPVGK